jgi:hypothetical protein
MKKYGRVSTPIVEALKSGPKTCVELARVVDPDHDSKSFDFQTYTRRSIHKSVKYLRDGGIRIDYDNNQYRLADDEG